MVIILEKGEDIESNPQVDVQIWKKDNCSNAEWTNEKEQVCFNEPEKETATILMNF